MDKIIYVTGNYGKYISVKERFEEANIEIDFFKYDFNEPEINDIEEVSKAKALEAYHLLGKPCFVADTGFFIDDYPGHPGYPGAFVKRSGISTDVDKLLETMRNTQNRSCRFIDCLTFYDGYNFSTFYGISEGHLSFEARGSEIRKAKSNLWYVFIPNNDTKTLAEMSDEERKNNHTSATKLFAEWFKNTYSYSKKLEIKKPSIN